MSDPSELLADALKEEGDRESTLQQYRNGYWLPIAERVIERGWRPPPRVIRTPEQLAALPFLTLIREIRRPAPSGTDYGSVHERRASDWHCIAGAIPSEPIRLPAVVIWEPSND